MSRFPHRLAAGTLALVLALIVGACAPPPDAEPGIPRNGTIAFVSERTGIDELYVMDADGTGVERLTNSPGVDRAPAWDATGTQLAFNSRREPHAGQPELYRMDFPTRALTRITDNPLEDARGAWSPGASAIVFQRGNFAGGFGLWQHDLLTGEEIELVSWPGRISAAPSISPDGTKLVFQSNHESDGFFPFRLYILDLATQDVQPFFHAPAGSDDGPRWSPDGSQVAFSSSRSGTSAVYIAEVDSGELRQLTDDQGWDISPAWSPDGSALVFQSDRITEDGGIHIVDLATGSLTYRGEGRTPAWSPIDRKNLGLN